MQSMGFQRVGHDLESEQHKIAIIVLKSETNVCLRKGAMQQFV